MIRNGIKRLVSCLLSAVIFVSVNGCQIPGESATVKTASPSKPPVSSDAPATPRVAPPKPSPSPIPTPVPTPEPIILVPQSESPVDDDFFADAAFVGNSLIEGFRLFSGLTTCDYYSTTSLSVFGLDSTRFVALQNGSSGTIYDGLAQKDYAKVYILLGINEVGYTAESFKQKYSEMIDKIRDILPDVDCYIMSLTPVSLARSSVEKYFTMDRVNEFNDILFSIASDKSCYYIDLCQALSDESGYLPAGSTNDGIHFYPSLYGVWLDYLKTHYVSREIQE